MFLRELKVNFRSFMTWTLVSIVCFLVVFLIYPSIINSDNIKMMNELMTMFPEEVLKAFNMDISSLDSAYGWLKSEGFVFILLITGCYASVLGSNILLKEESDKTIEYLISLPVTRNAVVIKKTLAGLCYIMLMILVMGCFNFVGLSLSGTFDRFQFILMSITPLFSSSVLYFLCMFLSTFTHKTKKMLGISLGVVFISYMLNMLASISKSAEFLKYFSVFTLADIRNVITTTSIAPIMIIVTIILSGLFFGFVMIRYNKKELIG